MGVEKEGSKNGAGYVGGFFHLFDWKAKSRKKLFSSKSDLLGTFRNQIVFVLGLCFSILYAVGLFMMVLYFNFSFFFIW